MLLHFNSPMAARLLTCLRISIYWTALLFFSACDSDNSRLRASRSESPPNIPMLQAKAKAGDPAAQARLGRSYMKGEGLSNNYDEAAHWFQLAAEKGNPDGQAGLGELYEAGRGVPKDAAKALEYYRKAATNGHAGAQYNLGFAYESGRGVPQDQREAAKWFLLAAQQGDPLSQYDLGQRYVLGVGVPANLVEALKWLTLAANQGQVDAVKKRNDIRSKMSREEIAEAERQASSVARLYQH
jgi:uncharacterized protein